MSHTLPPQIKQLEKEVIRQAPIGILACDSSGIVRVANPRAGQQLAGVPASASDLDLPGQPLADLLPELNLNAGESKTVSRSRWEQSVLIETSRIETDADSWTIIYISCQDERLERERLLEKEASTDELSGLTNRRAFQRTFEANLHLPLSLAIVDIDHFKDVNDRNGHPVGDDVIQLIGKLMRECFSDSAMLVSRMGGDEFSVLFETSTAEQIIESLEDFRSRIAEAVLPGNADLRVTVSVGAVISNQTGVGTRTLLTSADQELYKAKAAGRNRVTWSILNGDS